MSLDEVIEAYPVLRQSLLANYSDCALYAYFDLRDTQGWSTHPQAAGTLYHRFAAECLQEMRLAKEEQIPVSEALAVLEKVLEQRDIDPLDRVRLPLREIPRLRMAAVKFAKDNTFTIENLIDVELEIYNPINYVDDEGTLRERMLRGTPDAIVKDPEHPSDGVIVIDFKLTWALPPEREATDRDAAEKGLSYHGYFQQRMYAWLLLKRFPHLNWITLREFYALRSKARPATVHRKALPQIEEELANLVREFDRSLMSGKPKKLRYPEVAHWQPSPGKHCKFCTGRDHCPVDKGTLRLYAVQTEKEAIEAVGAIETAEARLDIHKKAVRPYIEEHGPVASRHSKGGRAYGLRTNSAGKPEARWFVPEGSDAAPRRKASDKPLEDAMRKAADEARAAKEKS
jgi:hypothetical protein